MEHPFHSFSELFKQLGLGSRHEEIESFLREARESDSDWSEVVDALNVVLRATDKSE